MRPRDHPRREAVRLLCLAATNYRTWLLMMVYAACFGVEITMYAVLPQFFMQNFGMGAHTASVMTAVFGSMDIFARPLGGISSDWLGRQFGMRGRLWLIFVLVALQGMLCIVLGLLPGGFAATVVSSIAFSITVQVLSLIHI